MKSIAEKILSHSHESPRNSLPLNSDLPCPTNWGIPNPTGMTKETDTTHLISLLNITPFPAFTKGAEVDS
jgi:hypothetical protein